MDKNTLLCTVGTSLFDSNLSRLSEQTENKPANWLEIKNAFLQKNWRELARLMSSISPSERILGAEINTIEEARKKKWLRLENLVFMVSDTESGKNTGEFLKHYFTFRQAETGIKSIESCVIEKLQDREPKDFKIHGLRNLVRMVGRFVERYSAEAVAIDATGGYKAQIAIAVIIGQALNIPVFYKHEKFSEIINFPPLPIAFDYEILGEYADLLAELENGGTIPARELPVMDEKLQVMLEEESIDGDVYYGLSPIGQVYLTGFRSRNPRQVSLIDAVNRRMPDFRDDHYPLDFKPFVQKVFDENKWISGTNTLDYSGQRSIKGIGFTVRKEADGYRLIGTFKDRNAFGARFWIHTTDESLTALTWAADYLNRTYR